MNLRHLEVFHAIMQTGTVTGAAHMLNVTQPAISNVLRHAESQIGFRLFERIAGRLHPTPEASDLFADVREVFGRIDTLNRSIEDIRSGRSGRLAIAASPTFVSASLPAALAALYRRAPGAEITLQALPSARAIEERVSRREVDIGVVYHPVLDPGVVVEEISRSEVYCAVPARSPLAGLEVIRPADLSGHAIVAPGASTRTGTAIIEASNGLLPRIALEVNASQTACLMAAAGIGIGLVDQDTVSHFRAEGITFRPFRPRVELIMCLIFPKDRPRPRLATQLAKELRLILSPA